MTPSLTYFFILLESRSTLNGWCVTLFLRDGNRGLPIPDRQSMTDPGRDITKVLIGEPMSLLGLLIGSEWLKYSFISKAHSRMDNKSQKLESCSSHRTTCKHLSRWTGVFYRQLSWSDPSLRSLSVSISSR